MTTINEKGSRPTVGKYYGFHHCEFWVANAKQVADWYCLRFGFEKVAYKGLETKNRDVAAHVIRQDQTTLVFSSILNPANQEHPYAQWISRRGDAVRDVAFRCDNPKEIWSKATSKGAISVLKPIELSDEFGKVCIAKIETYGGCVHSLIDDSGYKGVFLPGFKLVSERDPINLLLPSVGLHKIDHVVGNQPDGKMVEVADWYKNKLDFHRFWSVDDKQMHTQYSALRSIVMADYDENVKMPINEPAEGLRKSQIQEYVDYHGGAGVQHIAIKTTDILNAVTALKKRGVKFLTIPNVYYDDLRYRLSNVNLKIHEDLKKIQELNILVDFDDKGYLLQIFTVPQEDRPTLFFEIIQRNKNSGFGAGNFKALFKSIEIEQEKRGNLV